MPRFPLMLFAAGFGTRMKPLTDTKPKPLVPVAGRPLIDHALDLGRGAECEPMVANLHYLPQMMVDHLEGTEVKTVTERPDILETGGGLRNALPALGEGPVMTLNTDALWAGPNPLKLLAEAWDPEKMDALLMGITPIYAVGHAGRGDFIPDATGKLRRGPGVIYGGAQIIKPELLHEIKQDAFSLNLVWDRMLAAGRLYGTTYPGKWCDVGHTGGIPQAEAMLAEADV